MGNRATRYVRPVELNDFVEGTGLRGVTLEHLRGRDLVTGRDIRNMLDNISRDPLSLAEDDLTPEEWHRANNLASGLDDFAAEYYIHQRVLGRDGELSDVFTPIVGPCTRWIVAKMESVAPDELVWEGVNFYRINLTPYRSLYALRIYDAYADESHSLDRPDPLAVDLVALALALPDLMSGSEKENLIQDYFRRAAAIEKQRAEEAEE